VLVAHVCNPSYSGGRDQEDHGLKPETLSQKNPSQKKGGWSGSRWRPWVQVPVPHTQKKSELWHKCEQEGISNVCVTWKKPDPRHHLWLDFTCVILRRWSIETDQRLPGTGDGLTTKGIGEFSGWAKYSESFWGEALLGFTQHFVLARQACYYLSPFCFGYWR
jgi:hypothetical protein